jgi:hypothetical protein
MPHGTCSASTAGGVGEGGAVGEASAFASARRVQGSRRNAPTIIREMNGEERAMGTRGFGVGIELKGHGAPGVKFSFYKECKALRVVEKIVNSKADGDVQVIL